MLSEPPINPKALLYSVQYRIPLVYRVAFELRKPEETPEEEMLGKTPLSRRSLVSFLENTERRWGALFFRYLMTWKTLILEISTVVLIDYHFIMRTAGFRNLAQCHE